MGITLDQLLYIMPSVAERGPLFLDPLNAAMDGAGINTPVRQAMFLAQVAHESGELRWLRELWGPTQAQLTYEGRADLGNTQPGDGKRFLGRGLIQITGRTNYMRASIGLYNDQRLLDTPQLLEQRDGACLSAAWFWASHGLNAIADGGDTASFIATTRRINGGTNGLPARQSYWTRAKSTLGVENAS